MKHESDIVPCSIDVPSGWTAEVVPADGDDYPFVAIWPPARDARLRLTTFDPQSTRIEAAHWVELAAMVHRPRGRPIVPVSCGDFAGFQTEFACDDGRWLRGWML